MFQANSIKDGAMAGSLSRGLRAVVVLSIALGTSACVDGGDFPLFESKPAESADDTATRRATRLIERDVEAPEVFQVTEAGLWDGRPSLGGVWVAHPDVDEPERVLIRNTANDKFVIGALFRRERENPGPRVQVSSDAAEALGMLAGAPQNLNVTALRREEVPGAEEVAKAPPQAVEEDEGDAIASAAAAIDAAEGKPTAADGADTAEAPAPQMAAAAAAPEPAPKKKGFFARLFAPKKAEKPAARPEPAQASIAAPQIETATLDGQPSGAARVQKASAPEATQVRPAPRQKLDKPYLQIGIFSVEQNARNTATAMRQAGMIPTVRKQSSQGKVFWRVIVGPATSKDERAQLLDKVKGTGFTDAYAVTN